MSSCEARIIVIITEMFVTYYVDTFNTGVAEPEMGNVAAGFHSNQTGAQNTQPFSSVSSPVELRKWAESCCCLVGRKTSSHTGPYWVSLRPLL